MGDFADDAMDEMIMREGKRYDAETTITVEYYRLWAGNGGDHGTWDVDTIEIPGDTPHACYDQAIYDAYARLGLSTIGGPVIVGFYSQVPDEDSDFNDRSEIPG